LCESHSDAGSSLDNLDAILSFFEKFPEFLSNDLYLTGESYAGVYVPYLAFRIDSYNSWVEKSLVLSDHQHLDFNEFIRLKASQKH
jgi:carboxypeptidase C (cathepsin A)